MSSNLLETVIAARARAGSCVACILPARQGNFCLRSSIVIDGTRSFGFRYRPIMISSISHNNIEYFVASQDAI